LQGVADSVTGQETNCWTQLVESNHGLSRDKINAHEEFSPPKLGLTAEKKVNKRKNI